MADIALKTGTGLAKYFYHLRAFGRNFKTFKRFSKFIVDYRRALWIYIL